MKALLVVLLLAHSIVHAEAYRAPLSSSMGGTGRAGIDSVEGAFLNPALVPLLKSYEIDSYFRDGMLNPEEHRHSWGVGAGDNTEEVLFPGTLNFVRMRDTGRTLAPVDSDLWHVAIGKNFGQFGWGISGYRLNSKVENDREYVQWNYSLGVLYMINQDMGVAYVLNNIAKPSSDVPLGLREDLQQGAGFFATLGKLARVRADITRNEVFNPEQRMVYMLGCENMASSFGVFRMGYRWDDQRDQKYLTAGAGLQGPRLKLDYSFEKNLKGTAEALHSVDMRLPF